MQARRLHSALRLREARAGEQDQRLAIVTPADRRRGNCDRAHTSMCGGSWEAGDPRCFHAAAMSALREDSAEAIEIAAFDQLKPRLATLWDSVFPGDEEAYTSVIVP